MTTQAELRKAGAMSRVRSKLRHAIGGVLPTDYFTAPEKAVLREMEKAGQIRYVVDGQTVGVWTLNEVH